MCVYVAYVSVINFGTEVANECQSLAGRMMRCFFSPSPSGWPFMNVETDYFYGSILSGDKQLLFYELWEKIPLSVSS